MSVQSEIDRITENVANTYSALSEMGATMPEQQNSNNMASTVLTVPRGGGSVQSDWNQTDETAADFIKNKPFGDEVTEIMPETEVVGEDDGEGGLAVFFDPSLFTGVGENIVVTFDGTEYACAVNTALGVVLYGNLAFFGSDDTGEPFCIIPDYGACLVADAELHTIEIISKSTKKLDQKYVTTAADFYISGRPDEDCYIYTDIVMTNKATLAHLRDATIKQTVKINVVVGGITACVLSPLYINFLDSGCGEICIYNWRSSSNLGVNDGNVKQPIYKIYTAEYVPETT